MDDIAIVMDDIAIVMDDIAIVTVPHQIAIAHRE